MMKNLLLKTTAITLALVAGLCIATFAQNKKTTTTPKKQEHWIKVYRDVMMGDQANSSIGQFLITGNGNVVSVEDALKFQRVIGLVFFTEYYANYATLTFPGNATAAASYGTDDIAVFTDSPGGMNHWDQGHMASGMITNAGTSDKEMTAGDFNTVAESKDWNSFSKMFRQFNSGSGKLSNTSNFMHIEGNTVYMFQMNNAVRGFIYIKNLVPKSAKGGSIRFDMIVEGGDEFSGTDSNALQAGKD
jgi:hypothetical protein